MAKHNVWMSVSDLMTGLMVIFLFVAIAYMIEAQKNQEELIKNQTALVEYVETKQHLHDKLVSEFKADTSVWKMTIGKDLSMKFNNPEVLFASGSAQITPQFCKILDTFIPRYLDILMNDSLANRIQEIRVEGHTDDTPISMFGDSYLENLQLSQNRSYSVLVYIRQMPFYRDLPQEQQQTLEYWFTANGLSYGKAVDAGGEYIAISGEEIDRTKSRRVEFRIVTAGEEMLENFVKSLE